MFEVAMPAAGSFEELREPLGRREAASARLVVLAFQVRGLGFRVRHDV